jgi:hypothetical protein
MGSGYLIRSARWTNSGWDAAPVLRSYKVEAFKASNGHYKHTTTHTFNYRKTDSYKQVGESMKGSGRGEPNDGTTTARTYNVNNELVQFSDSGVRLYRYRPDTSFDPART